MDILEIIKKDHGKVEGFLKQIKKTGERDFKRREQLFSKLKVTLDAQAEAKEEIFYPVLQDAFEAHDVILEAHEEQREARRLLEELEAMNKDSDTWTDKFLLLMEKTLEHNYEEETAIFSKARRLLTKDQRIEMGDLMQQRERTLELAVR